MNRTDVTITIGVYEIRPHATPDGRVFIEIMQVDGVDAHDHPMGETRTVVVDDLFKDATS